MRPEYSYAIPCQGHTKPNRIVFYCSGCLLLLCGLGACEAPATPTVQFQPNVVIYSATLTPEPTPVPRMPTATPAPVITRPTATTSGAIALIASPTPGSVVASLPLTAVKVLVSGTPQPTVDPAAKPTVMLVTVISIVTVTPSAPTGPPVDAADATSTPTRIVSFVATRPASTPTAAATTGPPALLYDAPILTGPLNGERSTGVGGPPILWLPSKRMLESADYYAVTIHHKSGWDVRCYKGTNANPPEYLPMLQPSSGFDAWVTVVRLSAGVAEGGSCSGQAVSPSSATTNFYWSRT